MTSLSIKDRTYTNGDRCPDGRAGTASILVNGRPVTDVAAYVLQDGDQVEFRFGP